MRSRRVPHSRSEGDVAKFHCDGNGMFLRALQVVAGAIVLGFGLLLLCVGVYAGSFTLVGARPTASDPLAFPVGGLYERISESVLFFATAIVGMIVLIVGLRAIRGTGNGRPRDGHNVL